MVAPRPARITLPSIDTYCELYRDLFVDVRAYESFKYLHFGLISNLKRKTLPAIAEVVGLKNAQGLHHFVSQSPWSAEELRKRRLALILKILEDREIQVIIDETGDVKKGNKTDYVKRQYIGNVGKVENGIVSVNAYGYVDGIVFPLIFQVYKPRERLKEGEQYETKPEIGAKLVKELVKMGFKIKRVLADSLYGESGSNFWRVLDELNLEYAVGIRGNHGVWLPKDQKVRVNKWREFPHIRWDGKEEKRYIREIIYGKRRTLQYWEITTDKENVPSDSTWLVMTKIPGIKYREVGGVYKIRAWEETGFRNVKNELGWSDFRFTDYAEIEKWWELVMSAYLLVCFHNESFNPSVVPVSEPFSEHSLWDEGKGWKNGLNNLQLMLQPFICFNLIIRWLKVFPIPQLSLGFPRLIDKINDFNPLRYLLHFWNDFYCSSA